VLHPFGRGKVLYSAGVIESWDHESQQAIFGALLRLLIGGPPCFETDAPAAVEATLFDQQEAGRLVLHLLNFQQRLPNIPVFDLRMRIRTDGRRIREVSRVPDSESVEFTDSGGVVEFTVPRLDTYEMYTVGYR
jgi:hypothetical protein